MKKEHNKKKLWKILAISIPVAIIIIIFLSNHVFLQSKMNSVIEEDSRNFGIKVSVHYQYYINPNILVYDLKEIAPTQSKADVFRVFLQFADKIQDDNFESVHLAYNGNTKFLLSGADFKTIGEEYEWQNPVYTMRTFPEKLYTPDGLNAFSSWEGGILGVAMQQMEEFNQFHDEWYMNDMINSIE